MIQNFGEICKSRQVGGCHGCKYAHNVHSSDCAHEYYTEAMKELQSCDNCDHADFAIECRENFCTKRDFESLEKNSYQYCKNYQHTFQGSDDVKK